MLPEDIIEYRLCTVWHIHIISSLSVKTRHHELEIQSTVLRTRMQTKNGILRRTIPVNTNLKLNGPVAGGTDVHGSEEAAPADQHEDAQG